MKLSRVFLASVLIVALGIIPVLASDQSPKSEALNRLNSHFPGLKTYSEDGQLSRIYGKPFGYGSDPESAAEQFRQSYSKVYGVDASDLHIGSDLLDGRITQPVMYDRNTDSYKFTLVYYSQYSGDIPVFRSDLRLLVLNQPDYPLVMAASSLKDLGDFTAPAISGVNENLARSAVLSFNPALVNISVPKSVIWAGYGEETVSQPVAAMQIVADNGLNATPEFQKWLLLVDAQTGQVLYSEDMIVGIDVTGNVSGMGTPGPKADICTEEVPMAMPYARVEIQGGNMAFADENGDFTITDADSTELIVNSDIRGQWFRVFNQTGQNLHLADTLTPPETADFLHNADNISEYDRAQVNGYISANVVRSTAIHFNPEYPGLQQNEFPVNVNLNDVCNAYYDYSSINFFRSGGGCPNTAFSVVVYHEYGHHLVNMAGSGQGAYGEGMGDVMGVLISDDPILAYGFEGNCNAGIRNADNNLQYPCSGEIHYCGQLISGCVWSARVALEVTYPNTYMEIIGNLAVNAMLLHTGDQITPSITIDYLTLDDDNGNIYDGTPHYDELCAGFNAHSMDCPEVHLIDFVYPNGHPDLIDPAGGTTMDVEVISVIQNPQPGTGMLHYNSGSGWEEVAMDVVSPNVYQAVFPAVPCPSEVQYYFSAETDQGQTVTDPSVAPLSTYALYAATGFTTIFEDNFEEDLGWTVQNSPDLSDGPWERAIPFDTTICYRGNPPSDYDGSGYCYVTDNDYSNGCNSDVDNGYTYLISPTMDFTGENNLLVSYALWYTNNAGDNPNDDYFRTYVSSDDGATWIQAEEIGPVTQAGWFVHKFLLNDFIEPNAQVKFRFEASDLLNAGSVVEAGVDAFKVERIECEPTSVPGEIETANLPTDFALLGAYPNPFNAQVTIKYALPTASNVKLEVFDLLGRKIETLVDGYETAGFKNVIWNAENRSTGMYFYRISMGNFTDTGKMTLLK